MSLSSAEAAKAPPTLADGVWHKMGTTRQGIYKLSFQYLQKNGIVNSETNPQHIRIFGQGGGMLPQENSTPRPDGLQENAIFVSGEEDGRFDDKDYILFYAQGPDKIIFNPEQEDFEYEKNLYSDTVFYFITVSPEKGKRINSLPDLNVNNPLITSYNAFAAHENDLVNILDKRQPRQGSGRRWFDESLPSNGTKLYQLPLYNLEANQPVKIRAALVSTDTGPVSVLLSANNSPVATLTLPGIPNPEEYPYSVKGAVIDTVHQINSNSLGDLSTLSLQLKSEGPGIGAVYPDYLTASAVCRLQYRGEPLFFRAAQSLAYPEVRYQLTGAADGLTVWDISGPQNAALQQADVQGQTLSFGASSANMKEYVAFQLKDAMEPVSVRKTENQNLRADLAAEMLIVCPPALLGEANRLADFRTQHDGLQVKVATTSQIYNEFSSGAQDVSAIRDYARYLYQSGGKLRYLLLFGRGYFDYKKRTEKDYNLVPVYESYNSVDPIYSYASDDYYGFLEEDEGKWEESASGNHSLDIGIGRLPVKDPQEARQVIDKLIRYSTATAALGNWRTNILFIADDEDGNVHHTDADRLAGLAEHNWPDSKINKMYLGAYEQEPNASGQKSPKMTEAINKAIEQGALIVNYTGHGNWERLTDEFVITKPVISKWNNTYRLPLVVTATCDYGRHDAHRISGAEELILKPEGGAIGLLTTSRPVYSHTNFEINSSFYDNVFPPEGEPRRRLGDIVRLSKNQGTDKGRLMNRNFLLLGDPSMMLAYPKKRVVIDRLTPENNSTGTDTLGAFTKVKGEGFILNGENNADVSFNGTVEVVVFEKPVSYETLIYDEKTPRMEFTLRDNVIFRGKATVRQGAFSFNFVVPKSIVYKPGQGKINLYAVDEEGRNDASGYYDQFKVGGSGTATEEDHTPPEISLFLNDSSFVNGSKVGQESILFAWFKDENGINLTNSGVEGGIIATLDDQTNYDLSGYYYAAVDNYKSGSLQFTLKGLLPGEHRLRLTVRDTYNNISKSEISFVVGEKDDFEIYKLINYPNPFQDRTRFYAEHSRAGENIEAELQIYSLSGKLLFRRTHIFEQSKFRLELDEWNVREVSGKNLLPGVYMFKVILRSLSDNSRAERTEKLVILN